MYFFQGSLGTRLVFVDTSHGTHGKSGKGMKSPAGPREM